MKLLFVPLDVEVTETNFELGERQDSYLEYWESFYVIGKENNYQKYRSLVDQLPFVYITAFAHKIQKTKIGSHYDYHGESKLMYNHFHENEPAGYHVVLNGKCDSLKIYNDKEWVNPILPHVPIAYLLNITSCLHRVKEDNLRKTLYIQGFLNVKKHNELIERSLKRYGDLAIYSKV
jgi:hypothetical protein